MEKLENNFYSPFTFTYKFWQTHKENKNKTNLTILISTILLSLINYLFLIPIIVSLTTNSKIYIIDHEILEVQKAIYINIIFALTFFLIYILNLFIFNTFASKLVFENEENQHKITNKFKNTLKSLGLIDIQLAILYFLLPIIYVLVNNADRGIIKEEVLSILFLIAAIWLLKFLIFDVIINVRCHSVDNNETEEITKYNNFMLTSLLIQIILILVIVLCFGLTFGDAAWRVGFIKKDPMRFALYAFYIAPIPITLLISYIIKIIYMSLFFKKQDLAKSKKVFLTFMPIWIWISN